MRRFLYYFLTSVVLISLNSALQKYWSSAPNFAFVLLVLAGIKNEGGVGFLWLAFCTGLLLDTFSNSFFGIYTLTLLTIVLTIYYTTKIFISADTSFFITIGIASVSYLVFVGFLYMLSSIAVSMRLEGMPFSVAYLNGRIWIEFILSSVCAIPLYYWSEYLDRLVEQSQQQEQMPHV